MIHDWASNVGGANLWYSQSVRDLLGSRGTIPVNLASSAYIGKPLFTAIKRPYSHDVEHDPEEPRTQAKDVHGRRRFVTTPTFTPPLST